MELIKTKYKQTEVGLIPEDWAVFSYGELFKVIGGGTFKSRDRVSDGAKWLKIANVGIKKIKWDDLEYLPISFLEEYGTFLLKENDVVMALTRPILSRKLKISQLSRKDVPCLLNQRVGKIEPNSDNNLKWLYHLLQSNKSINGLLDSMAGTDPPNLSNKGIYAIKTAVPPTLTEQKAIATALSDVDDLIANLDKLITKKKAIKQGAMQQLLTPPNKGGKRLAGFSGEWMEKKLGDVLNNYELGGNYENIETESDYPLIKMGNLGRGNIKLNKVQYIPNHIKPMDRDLLNYGDVLFNTRNTLDLVGKISIWKNELPKAYFNSNIMRLDFNENHVGSSFFMNYILNTPKVITDLKSFATGTTSVAAIYTRDLLKLELCLPSPEEQKAIAHLILDLDNEIQMLISKKVKYQDIKQGMMQELLTGKTRLV